MSEHADRPASYTNVWSPPPAVSANLFEGLGTTTVAERGAEVPLNVQALLDRCMGSRQLAERLLQTFAERFPKDLEVIRTEMEAESHESTAKAAHRLKGACGNASADELALLAADLETTARAGQSDQMQQAFRGLTTAWNRFVAAREAFKRDASTALPNLMA